MDRIYTLSEKSNAGLSAMMSPRAYVGIYKYAQNQLAARFYVRGVDIHVTEISVVRAEGGRVTKRLRALSFLIRLEHFVTARTHPYLYQHSEFTQIPGARIQQLTFPSSSW